MKLNKSSIALLTGCIVLMGQTCFAEIVLPKIIADHMVLQREMPVPIWGWGDPGKTVTVEFAGQKKTAKVDDKGQWEIKLDPMEASAEPREMKVFGGSTLTLKDILVGEVWLASGQSNMEWSIKGSAKEDQEFLDAIKDMSQIRAFQSPHVTSPFPLSDGVGNWVEGKAIQAQKTNSAVGTFFAWKLHLELGVPVGFLDLNWGGQKIEKFIPDEGYAATGLDHQPASDETKANYLKALTLFKEQVDQAIVDGNRGIFRPLGNPPSAGGGAQNDIYNAMIAPAVPFAIRGAIWYQGESNREATDYFEKIKKLSAGWSEVFNVKNIPLLMVKIAPFDYRGDERQMLCDNIWTAQFKADDEIPGVGVVPIQDTQIPLKNIHPPFKRVVGERLAQMALARHFGNTTYPKKAARIREAKRSGKAVLVSFEHADKGLTTTDGKAPTYFELSADGKDFVEAPAEIKGDQVSVALPDGLDAKFIRMGWYEDVLPNLTVKDGWPVLPFAPARIE